MKFKNELNNNGYVLLKSFLDKEDVNQILIDSKNVFYIQFKKLGYIKTESLYQTSDDEYYKCMFRLFEENTNVFINCGKQVQHLISLHRLSLNDKVISLVKDVGLSFPNISTRPVLYFNHPKLAKEKVYHTVDAHQDWRSMQGSLNSVVIWIPLIDIDKKKGALEIIPGSHLNGLVTNNIEHGFGMIDKTIYKDDSFISISVEVGDILLFSSLLIHQSGNNVSNTPRWSCHFRYNDLYEETFINRGYPHAYIYKPVDNLLTENFPTQIDISNTFKNE
jgi:ectoine hydroxylase-related dioxygenase (phytanoyl-CoA dioxygenase family)